MSFLFCADALEERSASHVSHELAAIDFKCFVLFLRHLHLCGHIIRAILSKNVSNTKGSVQDFTWMFSSNPIHWQIATLFTIFHPRSINAFPQTHSVVGADSITAAFWVRGGEQPGQFITHAFINTHKPFCVTNEPNPQSLGVREKARA